MAMASGAPVRVQSLWGLSVVAAAGRSAYLCGIPWLSWDIWILQPLSAWSRVICSPPRPMIRPTMLSGTITWSSRQVTRTTSRYRGGAGGRMLG